MSDAKNKRASVIYNMLLSLGEMEHVQNFVLDCGEHVSISRADRSHEPI